jgi:hypothetical protein
MHGTAGCSSFSSDRYHVVAGLQGQAHDRARPTFATTAAVADAHPHLIQPMENRQGIKHSEVGPFRASAGV